MNKTRNEFSDDPWCLMKNLHPYTVLSNQSEMPPGFYLIRQSWFKRYALPGSSYRVLTEEQCARVMAATEPLGQIWDEAIVPAEKTNSG